MADQALSVNLFRLLYLVAARVALALGSL